MIVSVPSVLVATRILETSNFVGVFSEVAGPSRSAHPPQLSLPVDIGKLQLVLAWHERTHVNPAHQWFRERIADAMRRVAEGSEPKGYEDAAPGDAPPPLLLINKSVGKFDRI